MATEHTSQPPAKLPRVSYAQNMEDILLDRVFGDRRGTFMDVGAHHPIVENNTYFFYLRGWRGVNLEPLRTFYDLFLKHRPEDVNLNVAASNAEGTATFYEVAQSPGLSTLVPEVAEELRRLGHDLVEHAIRIVPIRSLIAEHGLEPPDVLTVDVESHEPQVFEGIPLETWRPKVLVVESTLPNSNTPSHQQWEPMLLANGYLFAAFNGINRFYLREDLRAKLACFASPVNFLDLYRRYETVHFENYARDLERHIGEASAACAAERQNFEAARVGWEREREQFLAAQRAWERERAARQEGQGGSARARTARDRERRQVRQDQAPAQFRSAELQPHVLERGHEAAPRGLEDLAGKYRRVRQMFRRARLAWGEERERLRRDHEAAQSRAEELTRAQETARQTIVDLQKVLEGHQRQVATLTNQIELLAGREKELRALLLDAHDQLLRRDEELFRARGYPPQPEPAATPPEDAPTRAGESQPAMADSPGIVHPRWEAVHPLLPPGAGVIVAHDGDEQLLQLGGRPTWPFPAAGTGVGADDLPADAAAAIAQLEEMRAQGARYLLFPREALWWLGYLPELPQYLEERFPVVAQEGQFLLLELPAQPEEEELRWHRAFVQQIRDLVQRRTHPRAWTLVVTFGDEDLIQFGERNGERQGSHFPPLEGGGDPRQPAIDGAAAIGRLEELRAQGAQYLLVPAPMQAWLDQHEEFKRHVETHYGANAHREEVGALFPLAVPSAGDQDLYDREVEHVQDLVNRRLPRGSIALVISQGDERFVRLGEQVAWHFPRGEDGSYAGYPPDDDAAVAHLEELRARGAEFLVVPYPGHAWLEYYGHFRLHLEARYRLVTYDALVPEHIPTVMYALTPRFQKRPVTDRPFGANIAGNLSSEKGTGEAVRSLIRSAEAAEVPHVVNDYPDADAANVDTTVQDVSSDNPYRYNIIQVNADSLPFFVARMGESYLHEHYNVGYWFWELADFPSKWDASFQYLDEIWVGSQFGAAALSRVSPVPVVRVPLSVTPAAFTRVWERSHFDLPAEAFVFLFIFDFRSVMERKNPLGLIEAFKRAFCPEDKARLVLKSARSTPEQLAMLAEAAQGANVQVVDTVLGREELLALLRLSDCYVSLHRSEGFGHTLAEAMGLGKPAIATGYSGNLDFMTTGNSLLVNYRLVELERDYGPYEQGCVWADPDLDQAAELMRFVYDNPEAAQELGARAQAEIREQLSPQAVGRLIRDRLVRLGGQ